MGEGGGQGSTPLTDRFRDWGFFPKLTLSIKIPAWRAQLGLGTQGVSGFLVANILAWLLIDAGHWGSNERIIQKSNHRLTRFRISIHLHSNQKTVNETYYSCCIDNCSDGQSFSLRNKYQLTPGSQLMYVTAVQPFD